MDPIIQQITSTLGNLFQGGLGGNVHVHTINTINTSQFQNQNANNNAPNSSNANNGNLNSDMEYFDIF